MNIKLTDSLRLVLEHKGHDVWAISPHAMVYHAIETMAQKHIGALLVMTAGRPVGIVSERDYARKVILMGRSSKETSVEEIMTTPVVYVTPEHTVEECLEIMSANRIRYLPVIHNERVQGILSMGDMVNWLISAQEATIHQLNNYIAGRYPG